MAERSKAVEDQAVREASAAYSVEPDIATAEDVPPGYKRTRAGVIPSDWEALPAREIGVFKGGTGFPITDQGEKNGKYPFFKVSDMNNEGNETFMRVANHYISEATRSRLGATAFPHESIVFAKVGAAVFLERKKILGQPSCIDNNMAAFVVDKSLVNVRYVHSLLLNKRLGDLVATTALPALNGKQLGEIVLPVPPLPEQRTIATALSDADALIESLDRLIAKKRAIKQAAMQQLLTGQTRLPGFTGEWETKRLGDVGTFYKGQGIRRDDVSNEGVPCIRYGEIYTRYGDCVLTPESRIPETVAEASFPLRTGDILFAGSGETAEEIGMCVAYLGEQPAFAGGDIVVLRPNEGVSAYLGRLLNHPIIAQQKARLGQGDAVVHISARNLAQIEVQLPRQEEQTAIATVLSDMDTEIEALERRRDKARQIKQGMMQQLLTGRVRLVQPNVAHAEVGEKPEATKGHSKQFNEAVVISMLASHFGTEEFPLGRKRYTKLSYLLHRHTDGKVEDYLKKAAGPYNPKTKYGGAEKIALKKGYLKEHKGPRGHSGFILADNTAEAERYFHNWYGPDAVEWLDQFRFKSNDELEVLATVDMAAQELRAGGHEVDVSSVKGVIQSDAEWQSKLNREVFSDENIAQAIAQSESLLRPSRKGVT